jgi:CDP-diacylglycerol--serine O-phosphatidyltransferase
MLGNRGKRRKGLPVNSLIPNILTVLAVCAGVTSIRFSLEGHWELSVMAIAVAAILDTLDGRVARLLKGTSKFGAELDSLSDFVGFGVAPAILLYRWILSELGGVGWIIVLAYVVCCGLRLARFNTTLDDPDRPAWTADYFTGVPAPAAAGLVLLPVMLSFQLGDDVFRLVFLNAANTIFVAFMMVSEISTFSFKRMRVKRERVMPVLIVVGLLGAVVASYPWFVLSAMTTMYLASIPLAVKNHRRKALTEPEPEPEPVAAKAQTSAKEEDEDTSVAP